MRRPSSSGGFATVTAFLSCFVLSTSPALAGGAAPANVVGGTAEQYSPALAFDAGPTLLVPSLLLGGRVETADSFAIDADDTSFDPATSVDLLARVGLLFTSYEAAAPFYFGAELELDAFTGLITDAPAIDGEGMPNSGGSDVFALRKANATVSYKGMVTLKGGVMTSHWGLGLLANDGAHFWEPGSADFTDPRGGDRVIRGQLIGKSLGTEWAMATIAFDSVLDDDVLRDGDEAFQALGAVLIKAEMATWGVYWVGRFQEADDGAALDAYVLDMYADGTFELADGVDLTIAGELALVWGRTTLAGSPDFPEHDILQLGGIVRAKLDAGSAGGVLDLFYGSGDQNTDDKLQNAFKADPNFRMGMLLFPYAMAAQTGRAPVTASNLELLGHPPEDLERFPTRGSVSNTFAIFPRFWFRPLAGLEVYGGPLFAFADVAQSDPFNTRLAGGDPRNAFDVAPGSYLGTELDLGLRYRLLAWGSELTLGIEGGALFPGDAIERPGAGAVGTTLGGRAMLTYKL